MSQYKSTSSRVYFRIATKIFQLTIRFFLVATSGRAHVQDDKFSQDLVVTTQRLRYKIVITAIITLSQGQKLDLILTLSRVRDKTTESSRGAINSEWCQLRH